MTPAGTSNERDAHNEWEETHNTHTHTGHIYDFGENIGSRQAVNMAFANTLITIAIILEPLEPTSYQAKGLHGNDSTR